MRTGGVYESSFEVDIGNWVFMKSCMENLFLNFAIVIVCDCFNLLDRN